MENVLLILHELQNKNPHNFLTEKDLIWVSKYLNVTYSQVYGVASYYTLFSLKPRGRHIIRVCRSPVCQMLGSDRIFERIELLFNLTCGATTPDGRFTLEPTECIGQCHRAPCISVDDSIYGGTQLGDLEGFLNTSK